MDKRGRSRRGQLLCAVLLLCGAAPGWGAPVVIPPSQQEYWARFDKQDWDAAIASAQQLVDAARTAEAPPDKLADALALLGDAQLGKKDFAAAQTTFNEALQLIEPIARSADSRLITPLEGMGFALAGQNKHAAAVTYMEKALALSRRSGGLFDLDQQDILRQLATSLTALGQPEAADQHMRYMVRVGEHAYGAEDPRLAPLLCTIGDWYSQRGQVLEARELYRNALGIVEKKLGRNDLAAVEALRSLAQSYIREVFLSNYGIHTQTDKLSASPDAFNGEAQPINPRFLAADGERALLRALAILEANPKRSVETLADTLLQLGDWYQVKQQPDKALPYYSRAWSAVAGDATLAAAGKEAVLGFPVQVYYPTPSLATRNLSRPPGEVIERFVQVEFTVLPDGTTKDERVVDQDATSRQASQTIEAIRGARYRPKFQQGQPVETKAVSYRQVFKQRKEKDSE